MNHLIHGKIVPLLDRDFDIETAQERLFFAKVQCEALHQTRL